MREMSWLPNHLPASCCLIVSCPEGSAVHEALAQRLDTLVITSPPLRRDYIKADMVKQHLATHHKSLTERQLEMIIGARLSHLPLYLTTVVNELRVFGGFEQLNGYIMKYSDVESLHELWTTIVTRWMKEYGHDGDGVDG